MFNGFFGSRSSNANSRSASRSNSGRSNNSRRSNNSHNSRISQCPCTACTQPIHWYAIFRHIDPRRQNATQELFRQMNALEAGRVRFVEAEFYLPSSGESYIPFTGPPGVTDSHVLIEYAIAESQTILRSNRTRPAMFPSIQYR